MVLVPSSYAPSSGLVPCEHPSNAPKTSHPRGRTQGHACTTQLMHKGVSSRHTPVEPSHGPIEPQRAAPDPRSMKQKVCDGNCPHVDIVPPLPPHSQQLPHHRQPHRTNLHASPPPGRPRCRPCPPARVGNGQPTIASQAEGRPCLIFCDLPAQPLASSQRLHHHPASQPVKPPQTPPQTNPSATANPTGQKPTPPIGRMHAPTTSPTTWPTASPTASPTCTQRQTQPPHLNSCSPQ